MNRLNSSDASLNLRLTTYNSTIYYKNCQKLLKKEIESFHYFTFVVIVAYIFTK